MTLGGKCLLQQNKMTFKPNSKIGSNMGCKI